MAIPPIELIVISNEDSACRLFHSLPAINLSSSPCGRDHPGQRQPSLECLSTCPYCRKWRKWPIDSRVDKRGFPSQCRQLDLGHNRGGIRDQSELRNQLLGAPWPRSASTDAEPLHDRLHPRAFQRGCPDPRFHPGTLPGHEIR